MNTIIMEILLCYWVISFMLILILCIDIAMRSIKNFIVTLLVSALLGWIIIPIKVVVELVRLIK